MQLKSKIIDRFIVLSTKLSYYQTKLISFTDNTFRIQCMKETNQWDFISWYTYIAKANIIPIAVNACLFSIRTINFKALYTSAVTPNGIVFNRAEFTKVCFWKIRGKQISTVQSHKTTLGHTLPLKLSFEN